MPLVTFVATRVRTALTFGVVAVGLATGLTVAYVPAAAAATRPALNAPFTCGQTWFSRTYAGHPQFAVDWNLPGSGEADFGQPVLAGGDGVATVETNSGYGQMVTIDHGDGWTSLYAHLSSVLVATGQRVARDTMVGRVGRTGRADGSHLHQEQRLNGVRQPIELDGHAVVASYSSRGSSYASANCAPPAPAPPRVAGLAWGRCSSARAGVWALRCGSVVR